MVVFGGVKGLGRLDRGDDGIGLKLGLSHQRSLRLLRQGLLFVAVDEDFSPVLAAFVAKLTAIVHRVNVFPEYVDQGVVVDLGGVVDHLHRLHMASAPGGDFGVGGVNLGAAGIARGGGEHPV